MTFQRENGGRLYLSKSAVNALLTHRQVGLEAHESGGVLLGRLIVGTKDIVVDEVTLPTTEDRSGRYSFFRGKRRTQRRVNDVWHESGGTRIYLGEWHTHPENHANPSAHDLRNWRRIMRFAIYEQDCLVFVIVGQLGIYVWEMSKTGQVIEMHAVPDQQSPLPGGHGGEMYDQEG